MSRPRLAIKKEQLLESKPMINLNFNCIPVKFKEDGGEIQEGFFKPCHNTTHPTLLAKYEVALSVLVGLTLKNAAEVRLVYDEDKIIGSVSLHNPEFVPITSYKVKTLADTLVSSYQHGRELQPERKFNTNGFIDYDELYSGITNELRPKINLKVPKYANIKLFDELKKNDKLTKEMHKSILKNILGFDKGEIEKRLYLYLENVDLGLESLSIQQREKLIQVDEVIKSSDAREPHSFIKHCMRLFLLEQNKFEEIVMTDPNFREYFCEISTQPMELLKILNELLELNKSFQVENIDKKMQQLADLISVGTQKKLC